METRVKRIVAALLTASMAFSFAACGSGESDAGGSAGTPVDVPDDPMAPYEQEVVISLGRQTGTNPRLPDGDTFEDNAYTRFVKEKLNIKIENAFEANGEDYDRQVSLAMASGELPDAMIVSKRRDLQELAENDMIADLNGLYDAYASDNLKATYSSYDGVYQGGAFAKSTFDGKLFGMPAVLGDGGSNVVWVRQDWAEKLGITVDGDGDGCITVAELKDLAKQFVEKDPGGTGKPVGIPVQQYPTDGGNDGGSITLTGIANAYNAFPKKWLKDSEGKAVYGSLTSETKQFLTDMAGWFQEGILDPQTGTRTWDDCMGLLVNNQAGLVFGPWHMPDWGLNQVKEKNSEAQFQCYAIADGSGKVNFMHVAPIESYVVVSAEYKHPEAVLKMMNLFYDQLAGKEAADVMPNINEAMKMDNSTKPFNIEVADSRQYLMSYEQIMAAVEDPSKLGDVIVAEDRKIVDEIVAYQKDPATASTEYWAHYNSRVNGLGRYYTLNEKGLFNWQTPPFTGTTESMSSMWTNLDKLENEAVIKILTGAEPPEYFDTFVSNWKAQGGDTITAEVDAQMNNPQ